IGGFDETMPALEDTDYCWRVQRAGHAFVFVPDAVVRIRHRHDVGGMFRQGWRTGRYNVLIYAKYRPLGMPRLGVLPGLLKWIPPPPPPPPPPAPPAPPPRAPRARDVAARLAARPPPRLPALPRRRALSDRGPSIARLACYPLRPPMRVLV